MPSESVHAMNSSVSNHRLHEAADNNLPWLVVYSKPRQEKKLAARLTQQGYEVYCPTIKVRKQWSDRVKVIDEPLFKSYVFIRIAPNRREDIFHTPGFVRYLFWLKQPAQVREEEIMTLKKWLSEFDHQCITMEAMVPGQQVRIQSGPLQGQDAVVTKQRGKHLELVLTDMQMVVKVDMSRTELSAV